jgi:hypothetical protein
VSPLAIAVMVVVCGVVWGGFAVLLTVALRREARRAAADRAVVRKREP